MEASDFGLSFSTIFAACALAVVAVVERVVVESVVVERVVVERLCRLPRLCRSD